MRILQLISSSGLYGAEAVVLGLSQELERLGSRSIVGVFCHPGKSTSELAEVAAARGLQFEAIPCNGKVDLNTILVIRQIVSRERIDAVHSHGYKSHLYAYLAVRHSCPLLATCHGHYSRISARRLPSLSDLKLRTYRLLEHNVLQHFDRVICVSEEISKELRGAGLSPTKVRIIGNGVDIDVFNNAAPAADIVRHKAERVGVGIVSRLVERKGHRELLQTANLILRRYPQTMYFVVGDGPLRHDLERLATEYGITSSVVFTGKRTDMPNVYSSLDIVVLPSHAEGLPMVVMEAMAAGKPVVASNVGGIPELIHDGRTGLLVEPGNHVSLRDSMLRLLEHSCFRERLGENGQALVRQSFSLAAMGGSYFMEYQRATERNLLAVGAVV